MRAFSHFSFAKDLNWTGKARQWNIWFWNSGKHCSLKCKKRIVFLAFVKSTNKNPLVLQTYGLQQKDSSVVEMCTFVRKVQEDSVAGSAGLTAGEWLTSFTRALHILSAHWSTLRSTSLTPHISYLICKCGTQTYTRSHWHVYTVQSCVISP